MSRRLARLAHSPRVALPARSKGKAKSTATDYARQATKRRIFLQLCPSGRPLGLIIGSGHALAFMAGDNSGPNLFLFRLGLVLAGNLLLDLRRDGFVVAELHCEAPLSARNAL